MEMDQYPTLKRVVEDPLEDDDAEDDLLIQENRTLRRKKRQAPYLIFPEILCIIDYDGYRYCFLLLFFKENIHFYYVLFYFYFMFSNISLLLIFIFFINFQVLKYFATKFYNF